MFAICECCGKTWSVLQDGTLTEHPQAECPYLLCTGSRTRPIQFVADERGDRVLVAARKSTAVLVAAN
jgi:hypothetical protein